MPRSTELLHPVLNGINSSLFRPEPYLGLLMFFSFFKILGALQITYYLTIDRVTYFRDIFEGTIVSPEIDSVIMYCLFWIILINYMEWSRRLVLLGMIIPIAINVALGLYAFDELQNYNIALLPILATLFGVTRKSRFLPHKKIDFRLLALSIVVIVTALEFVALIGWLLNTFLSTQSITYVEHRFFYALNLLSPYLMMLIIASFAVRYLINPFKESRPIISRVCGYLQNLSTANPSATFDRNKTILILLGIITASAAVAFFPHVGNQGGYRIELGVDNRFYVTWMEELYQETDVNQFLFKAFVTINGGDRPLALLLIHTVHVISGASIETTLLYLPMLLAPLLSVSVFLFVYVGTNNNKLALLGAFISALSYATTVGIYSAFLANWLALSTSVLALAFLLMTVRKPSIWSLLGLGLAIISTIFAHSYTGAFLIFAIILYLGLSYVTTRRTPEKIPTRTYAVILSIVIGILLIDVGMSSLFESLGAISSLNREAGIGLSLDNFARRWVNLEYVNNVFVGSYLGNIFLILPAAVWYIFSRLTNNFNRLIFCQVLVSIIPALFGNYIAQGRILYDLLLYIPASIIIYNLLRQPSNYHLSKITGVALIIAMTTYALRSLSNLNLILPQ